MYTFTETQEPADTCGITPTATEQHAIAKLLMLSAKGDRGAAKRLAAQIAVAFPQERARAKVREERDRARATR